MKGAVVARGLSCCHGFSKFVFRHWFVVVGGVATHSVTLITLLNFFFQLVLLQKHPSLTWKKRKKTF